MENTSKDHQSTLNLRLFALATLVPVAMMLVAMWLKPLWRDEYFSLYYADPKESLSFLAEHRWSIDAHPPFYNPFLRAWSFISENPFWQKCLSLVFAGLGAALSFRIVRPDERRHLKVFLLTCLGSYWVIYFATEIRPYVLNFTLSALLSLIALRLFKDERPSLMIWAGWFILGMALSLTHYFGALWFACLGFVLGVSKLYQKDRARFLAIGVLTVIALIPAVIWMKFSFGHMEFTGVATDTSLLEKLRAGLHQFLRGLLIKTFGSNPLITFLGFGGIMAAILGRRADYALLLRAAGLTLLLALCLHVGFVDMIKERAFIVIMPAILWVMAGHLSETKHKFGRYLPLVAAIMPFVFISEYFKNKEEIPELLAAINSYGPACESAALYVYHRPDPPAAFYEWTSRKVLGQNGRDLSLLVDIPLVNTTCPVLAAAVLLPKNNQDMIGTATEFMTRKGYAAEDIEIKTFGKGRSVVWIDKRLDQSPLK